MTAPAREGRDPYEVANQLAGYVGPDTPSDLAAFLLRESEEAAKLADIVTRATPPEPSSEVVGEDDGWSRAERWKATAQAETERGNELAAENKRLREAFASRQPTPAPADDAEVRPSRFGKQSEWWNSLTDTHRAAIKRNTSYGIEEAFNGGWNAALAAASPKAPSVAIGAGEVPVWSFLPLEMPVAIARCDIKRGQTVTADMLKNCDPADAPASASGEQTYASDDEGLFCRHCGRSHVRHFYKQGVGFVCDAPASASIPADVERERQTVQRVKAFAKSPHTTPEEHDDIMVAVRLAEAALAARPSTGGAMDGKGRDNG